MRYIIAVATAFALIVGIAIGIALTATVFEAEAKPPPEVQPVVEQNVDGSGFIAVHEQGTADVNVVSLPSQDSGPLEFFHIHAKLCTQGFCELGGAVVVKDVSAELTSLSSQGWELASVVTGAEGIAAPRVLFTLSRPVP